MTQWIHVVTDTKLPIPRSIGGSPYEIYEESFNPNIDTPFGPDEDSMFLEVQKTEAPVVNLVLEQTARVYTTGADGKQYHGEYLGSKWVETWEVLVQDISTSRELKTDLLNEDRDAVVSTGYVVGSFQFPLTEYFFRLLADRLKWLEEAVSALEVPSNTQLTFSDLTNKEVSVGIDTLRTHFITFGKEYLGMYEVLVSAHEQIRNAATPEAVDAVTWSF